MIGRQDRASLSPIEILEDLIAFSRGFERCPLCKWPGTGHCDSCPVVRAERLLGKT